MSKPHHDYKMLMRFVIDPHKAIWHSHVMKPLFTFLFLSIVVPLIAGDYHYIQTPQRMDKETLIEEIEQGKERGKTVVIKLDAVKPTDKEKDAGAIVTGELEIAGGDKIKFTCPTGGWNSIWRTDKAVWFKVMRQGDGIYLEPHGRDKPR